MKIAVILPSRGLIFSEVEDALEKELQGHEFYIYRSWNKVIPDAQNFLVDEALKKEWDYYLFIEEDTVIPEGGLKQMIALQKESMADIICIDYGVNTWSCTARDKVTSEILWCGFGCTLVTPTVLKALPKPYFRTDKSLRLNDWQWIDNPSNSAYGGQDIWFCTQARELGFRIAQVDGECKHLRLKNLGIPEINKGLHNISPKAPIEKYQYVEVPPVEKTLTINGHSVNFEDIGNHPTS